MKEYDPNQHIATVNYVPLSGFDTDMMISVEFSGQLYTHKTGVDGQVTRSRNAGITALITIHLMNSSVSNAWLSGLAANDRRTPGGGGVFPTALKDMNGTSYLVAPTSWIEDYPKPTRGKEATANEWKIRTDTDFEFFEGGSL